jgi:formamidopyrimidine-DNA glycosylase
MPELPEIETVRLQLGGLIRGARLESFEVVNNKVVKCDLVGLVGRQVESVDRRGKVLLINFGNGLALGFHFKMTGQLIYEESGKRKVAGGHPSEDFAAKMPCEHTRLIINFDKGVVYFNDQRLFGWVDINPKFLEKLGPEPFEMEAGEFVVKISKSKRPVKMVIMDQEIMSGVGNIYANDALWEAKINPSTPSNQIDQNKLALLFEKIILVLGEGIKYGGATAADAKYINLHGLGGHYQEHFRVYDREGKGCKRCGELIVKMVLGGRGTYFCPSCQAGNKE